MRLYGTYRRGFTLAELLVVVAILGVLLGLSLPQLARAADRAAVRAALSDAAMLFATARETAIHRRSAVAVEIDSVTGTVRARLGADTVLQRDLRSAYAVQLTATRDSMAYDARGLGVGAANLSLIVRRRNAIDTLFVSRLGRIRQ